MKPWTVLVGALIALAASAVSAETFGLQSPDLKDGQPLSSAQVFQGFGCDGGNVSPALEWSNAPAGTKSFAITVYDPDAPTESGWWHWTVFNIPATTVRLAAGAGKKGSSLLPREAMQGRTDFGTAEFGGACPPKGDKPHRYVFTVWALNVERLQLDESSSGAMVGFMLNAHSIGRARLQATYKR